MAYSTQASLEAKIKASRIRLWGDKDRDGTIDALTLSQGLGYAEHLIQAYLVKRFGAGTITAWTTTTVPALLKDISDDLALYYIASGSNAMSEQVHRNYEQAVKLLTMIRDNEIDLIDSTGAMLTENSTTFATMDVSTDEYNRVFTQEMLSTPREAQKPSIFAPIEDHDSDVETS